ncbi:MAG: monovalent cation/H+ antiporter subunit D family protein [Deltaproteobacteria bacterium]|nr:monovalent cation/H+ antiporter subunit D family protein [Deltaproteobacteria bacterium]
METIVSVRPLIAIGASLFAPLLIILFHDKENLRESSTFLAALVKFSVVLSMVPLLLQGREITYTLIEIVPGVSLGFRVDAFGLLFALVSSCLWIVTSAYSIGYMRGLDEHSQTRYFCYFALALSATIGVAFSANLLTLYLFYEMLSFATYPLVTHHQDLEARGSGRKYLFYIVGGSIGLVLPAMVICYGLAGTLEFTAGGFLAGKGSGVLIGVLVLMMLFGFAKGAVMPFHSWLPAAMVAPTPVSALLHAVAVVKVGVFSIVRVLTGVFGVGLLSSLDFGVVVSYIASFTIIVASLIALSQDELKRRLAFSTISQLSYIVLGVGLLSPKGMLGGMLHIAMHAFGKITLFFCAGAIFVATGRKYISDMVGIGRRMPVTMGAFFVGSLSVIGLPPCGGFISKWSLVLGTLESGQMVMLFVLLLSSLLNAAYFLPIVYRAFFCTAEESMFEGGVKEAPLWCVVPLVLTGVLFFYPQPFFRLAEMAVLAMIGG